MKNKCVLMRTSAVPEQTRRSALVNEVVRRLRNCHEDVEESEVADVLSRFSQKMRNSGYCADYRRQIISAGIKAHKEQKKREEAGGRPMFRTRNFEKDKRRRTKRESRFNWWKKNPGKFGKPVMMMKVPYTHGSKLLKKYKRVAESHSMEIKFVELSGYSLQNMLEKANPFGDGKCGRDDCFPCRSGKGKCCQKRGAAYEIVCCEEECREDNVKYCGESGRNGYSRG